ncbi:MAG: hypothetical protein NTY12_04330 [Candidatus Falkowbacteria bacterium]|nr:hypothetical protein [Candidatus Falkowbacteria bacterium]
MKKLVAFIAQKIKTPIFVYFAAQALIIFLFTFFVMGFPLKISVLYTFGGSSAIFAMLALIWVVSLFIVFNCIMIFVGVPIEKTHPLSRAFSKLFDILNWFDGSNKKVDKCNII